VSNTKTKRISLRDITRNKSIPLKDEAGAVQGSETVEETVPMAKVIATFLEVPTRKGPQGQPGLTMKDIRERGPIIDLFHDAYEKAKVDSVDLTDDQYRVVLAVFDAIEFSSGAAWIRQVVNAVADAEPIKSGG